MGNPSTSGYSISWPHLNGDEKNVAPCRACLLLQLNGDENNENNENNNNNVKMNFQFIDLPPQVKKRNASHLDLLAPQQVKKPHPLGNWMGVY